MLNCHKQHEKEDPGFYRKSVSCQKPDDVFQESAWYLHKFKELGQHHTSKAILLMEMIDVDRPVKKKHNKDLKTQGLQEN